MLKVVFDTVVFVRSLINPYSVCGTIVFRYFPRYRLFVSQPIIMEVLEVLRRPELTRRFRSLEARDVPRVVDLLSGAEIVEMQSIPAVCRDPKDDKFIATVLAAGADYLVTEDDDLLVLGEYSGTLIINAATFASILSGQG